MNTITTGINSLEFQLTEEESMLIWSTEVGMDFFGTKTIKTQDELLDMRLHFMKKLEEAKKKYDASALAMEISCIDLLLSLRLYIQENSPLSNTLIENGNEKSG